jgi:DNA-binding response OmpR family regulator
VYKILLVEDDAMIREAFSIVLQLSGEYEVTTAENGQVAITLCTEDTYDLILLDIMMPVLDGPGFLKEYATRWPDVATKVVIMSNLSSGSELSIARDYGVDRSVLKSSLTPGQLLAVVADVLDAKKNEATE